MNEGRKYRLNNDVLMPVIGQGTYHMTRKVLYDAMLGAFDCGCALLDTAHSYPNEESIGNELAKIFNGGKYLRKGCVHHFKDRRPAGQWYAYGVLLLQLLVLSQP